MQKVNIKLSQVMPLIVFIAKFKGLDPKKLKDFSEASRYVSLMLN